MRRGWRVGASVWLSPSARQIVFGALFARSIDERSEILGLATGEAVVHLNHLMHRGEAVSETGDDGVVRRRLKS